MQRKYSGSVKIFYPKYSRDDLLDILKRKVEALKRALQVSLVVLFGSYATDSHTAASDIDLLVVYKGHAKDAYAIVRKAFGLPLLEPHVYSEEEYTTMKETLRKMTANSVTIYSDGSIPRD
jgi:predicted nucleotidyltransferase